MMLEALPSYSEFMKSKNATIFSKINELEQRKEDLKNYVDRKNEKLSI